MVTRVPPMLRDIIVDAIAKEPDMEIMAAPGERTPRPRVWHEEPNVIVLGTPQIDQSQEAERCLAEWPHSRVLLVETSGRLSVMYELRTHRTPLGELSLQQLVEAIRSVRWSGAE